MCLEFCQVRFTDISHLQGYSKCFPDFPFLGYDNGVLMFTSQMACLLGAENDLSNARIVSRALWTFPKSILNANSAYNSSVIAVPTVTYNLFSFIDDLGNGGTYGLPIPARQIDSEAKPLKGKALSIFPLCFMACVHLLANHQTSDLAQISPLQPIFWSHNIECLTGEFADDAAPCLLICGV